MLKTDSEGFLWSILGLNLVSTIFFKGKKSWFGRKWKSDLLLKKTRKFGVLVNSRSLVIANTGKTVYFIGLNGVKLIDINNNNLYNKISSYA